MLNSRVSAVLHICALPRS